MTLKLNYLSVEDTKAVEDAAMASYDVSQTNWIDAPEFNGETFTHTEGYGESAQTRQISPNEALDIYKKKVDGAYTERFLLFVGQLEAIVKNGYEVALIQHQGSDGAPFDSEGWLVAVVEGLPIYHIAPWDLNLKDVKDLVTLIPPTESDNGLVCWKNTNKRGEFKALQVAVSKKGEDLVKIAKEFSY